MSLVVPRLLSSKSIEIYSILIIIVWTAVFSFSLWFNIKHEKRHVFEMITGELNRHYADIDLFRHWIANNGGIYVPVSNKIQPNPALEHFPEQTIKTQSDRVLTLVNTPQLLRLLSDEKNNFNVHMTSLRPLNPMNKADEWETKALLSFEQGKEEVCEEADYKSASYMRLIRPFRYEANCAECHFDRTYKEGDVLGGMTVSIPLQSHYSNAEKVINNLYVSHGTAWFLGLIGIGFGYGQHRSHEKKRKINEAQLRETSLAFNNLDEGLVMMNADRNIIAVNDAFSRITAYDKQELVDKNLSYLRSQFVSPDQYNQMMSSLQKTDSWEGEIKFLNKDDMVVPINLRIDAIFNAENNISKYILVFSDISERKEFEKTLDHLAHHDHLTNLPNRLLLNDRLSQAFIRSKRENKAVALLFLDLDNFKNINDSQGHHMGDVVLIEVTQRLKKAIRKQDTLARLGGDEFVVIIEQVESEEDVLNLANKLIHTLSDQFSLEQKEYYLGISIGISMYPKDAETVSDLLSKADIAMYQAKAKGKNNCVFYNPSIDKDFLGKITLESELRKAIENQEFILHYQPQVSINSNKIIGAECLIRWQHPEKGLMYPDSFIHIAESSPLMIKMGELVIEQACTQMQTWLNQGIALEKLSINIAAQQISYPDFAKNLIECIEKHKLPEDCLELEITENFIMEKDKESVNNLKMISDASIQVAVDDFGTGYSSLNYLKQLPISKIKIDRSFTDGLPFDQHDSAIIHAVIAIAKSLNFKVIAEGVENLEQLNFLKKAGCDEYQGYYCSEPLDATAFKNLLAKSSVI